jgi:putative flippase GtrA
MIKTLLKDAGVNGQITRYAISGGALTLFYSAVYFVAAALSGIAPLIANSLAFVLTVVFGFAIHSNWSFGGYGRRDRPVRSWLLFITVNLAGFALNSFWVWSIVEYLGGPVSAPLLPIIFVTPWLSFYLNRQWTFS